MSGDSLAGGTDRPASNAATICDDFIPQLVAAIKRHEECQNWCTWDNVLIAMRACEGDEIAQQHLREDAAWQLDSEGLLRAS